jgi:hypothetical protein
MIKRKTKELLPFKPEASVSAQNVLTDNITPVMPGVNSLRGSLTPNLNSRGLDNEETIGTGVATIGSAQNTKVTDVSTKTNIQNADAVDEKTTTSEPTAEVKSETGVENTALQEIVTTEPIATSEETVEKTLPEEGTSEEAKSEKDVVPKEETGKKVEEPTSEAGGGDGTRLTDMKQPELDGGVDRMKVQDKSILDQTEKQLVSFGEETEKIQDEKIVELGTNEKKKDTASTKLKKTESAVQETSSEKQSEVNTKQVKNMSDVKPPEVKNDQAENILNSSLDSSMPKTLEDVTKFKEDKVASTIGENVLKTVENKTNEISGTFEQLEHTEKPADPKKSIPIGNIEKPTTTPVLGLGNDIIQPVSKDAVDLSAYVTESDNLLKKEGITEENLKMVDSGDLAEANKLRKEVTEKAETEPAKLVEEEKNLKDQSKVELDKKEQDERNKMRKEREAGLSSSLKKQEETKTAFEKKKQEVTEHINQLYEEANSKVQNRLAGLEKNAMVQFNSMEAAASTTFENNVNSRIQDFKSKRYEGLDNLLWVKDLLFGIDHFPEVIEIIETERGKYITSIDKAIAFIIADSQKTIDECKTIIAKARKDIEGYVATLSPDLKKIGQNAQKDIQQKLDELDQKVNKAAEELKEALAEKRKEAIANIDKKIETMRAEMSGTLAQMGNLMMDAALKFFKWALSVGGYSMDDILPYINKGKAVLTSIVSDPGTFFKNLGDGVGGGITNFVSNAGAHLKAGLFDWLTGAMSGIPIQIPDKWDLKGIFSFISQLLGFGWETIKTKLGVAVGPENLQKVETAIQAGEEGLEGVQKIKQEGVAGAMEIAQDQIAEAKETAISEVSSWAIGAIIKAAIPKVLLMLNPAGAIAQIILVIAKTVIWFKNNFTRISKWANTVFESVVDIAGGSIGSAMAKVEQSMAQAIPVILAFLAEQLGLGNIAQSIQNALQKVRKPIDKIIDKIVAWISAKAKKIIAKVGKLLGKDKKAGEKPKDDKRTAQEKQNDLNTAVKEATAFLKEGGTKSKKEIDKKLRQLESAYQLVELSLAMDKDNETGADLVHVHGKINSEKDGEKVALDMDGVGDGLKIPDKSFSMSGTGHTMSIDTEGDVVMASRKGKLIVKLNKTIKFIKDNPEDSRFVNKNDTIISEINILQSEAVELKAKAIKLLKNNDSVERKKIELDFNNLITKVSDFAIKWSLEDLGDVTNLQKPYATSRPSYAVGQVETVWKKALENSDIKGRVFDPYTDEELFWTPGTPRNGKWDMGHIKGQKYEEKHDLYMKGKVTKKAFLAWYQNPDNYVPESVEGNRSRKNS